MAVDNFNQFLQLGADAFHVRFCVRVEKNLAQKGVVLGQHAFGNVEVALEGGSGCVLLLHYRTEDKGADKGNRERIGHGLVVLLEGVFVYVQPKVAVEVEEKEPAHVVALADDNGVLGTECAQIGKGGAEHGVGADVSHSGLLVELAESGLYGTDIADDAVGRQQGHNLFKDGKGVFECDGIDDQFGTEG